MITADGTAVPLTINPETGQVFWLDLYLYFHYL